MYHTTKERSLRVEMNQSRSAEKKAKAVAARESTPQAAKIIQAALGCIKSFGAAKTTMEDVATRAGVGRQTVYRSFANRTALFDAVALQRLTDMHGPMQRHLGAYTSLESAIVRGTPAIRSVARKDLIFMSIVESAGDRGLERYLLNPTQAIRQVMVDLWSETFSRARARGELRTDLTDADIADWLRFVSYMLFVREDLSAAGQQNLLRRFVLPALANPRG